MGRFFALTLGLAAYQTQIKTKPKKLPTHRLNFGIWLVVLSGILGISYLFIVNGSATKGYEIKSLEKQMVELREINKRLELEAASLKSIQNIEATAKTLNFVPSKKVDYLRQNDYVYDYIQ